MRDVTDLVGIEVALAGEVAPLPVDGAFLWLADAGDDLEEGALSRARGADDGAEMAAREMRGDFPQEHVGLAVGRGSRR